MDEEELEAAVAQAGCTDIRVAPNPTWGRARMAIAVECTLLVAGVRLGLGVGLDDEFPDSLPNVFVLSGLDQDLPHIESHRKVCVFEEEGTLTDHRELHALVRETVERAKTVLEAGLLGTNRADFLDEFEAYWTANKSVISTVQANDVPREISALYLNNELAAVADSPCSLASALPKFRGHPRPALYLPLDPRRVPWEHPRRFQSWSAVLPLLDEDALNLVRRTPVTKKRTVTVVLGFPRPAGGRALAGLNLQKFERPGSLADLRPKATNILQLDRLDVDRVRQRASASEKAWRVGVIGCGAVGGHVAHMLAWNGATELVLVDPERCNEGNTFRHVLGRAGWQARSKAAGLQSDLEARVPGLVVTPIVKTANQALASHHDLLRSLDLIVMAIGNASVPLRLNDEFASARFPVPVIYAWLEPFGIGGHALLVRYGSPGCLRCTFEDHPTLHCRLDFAAPGQRFARRELACHATYTPYADLDARETAIKVARLAQRLHANPDHPSWLTTWKGDATRFLSGGFNLSPHYAAIGDGLDEVLAARVGCSICGS
jgi:molybdopterin/thiamine biosynthesis adenylyltransferase